MAEQRTRHIKSIVEKSRELEAGDLLHNLDEELKRVEKGMGHMVWDKESRPVTMCACLLPISPLYEVTETASEFSVKVMLPSIRMEDIEVKIESGSIEVFAVHREKSFRPFLLAIDAPVALDPKSLKVEPHDGIFVIRVRKVKRHRVNVKSP